jgi:anthranilate synthase component 1
MPVQPVDLPATFDFLHLHARNPGRYPYLLETLATDPGPGDDGFDILFAFPGAELRLDGAFHLSGPGAAGRADFLDTLDAWWLQERVPPAPATPLPFHGGWFLLLAYELLHQIEPRVPSRRPAAGTVAIAVRVPVALLRNRRTGQAWIVGEPGHEGHCAARASDIEGCLADPAPAASAQPVALEAREPDPAAFEAAVDAVRALIARGDVYQVNLARHWCALLPPGVTAPDLYRRLRLSNPAPFGGLATFGDWSVISSSPERLVRSRAGLVDTRPIAGTRPRAEDPRREDAMRRNLLASPKERAEHVMLIDLERNDLGRVCVPGTVEVDEFMAIET